MYYFIEKMGVYAHGIFWIGKDLDEAKREADRLATEDRDTYHNWNVLLFDDHACMDADNDPTHSVVYTGVRVKEGSTPAYVTNNTTPLGVLGPYQ